MADSPTQEHSSDPQLTALLFCRDVIIEAESGMISPFRLVERAEIPVPAGESDITIWQSVEVRLFIGISCHGADLEHEHSLRLKGLSPLGSAVGDQNLGPAKITKSSANAYKSVAISLPGHVSGRYSFEVWLEEKLAGVGYFTVLHRQTDAQVFSLKKNEG